VGNETTPKNPFLGAGQGRAPGNAFVGVGHPQPLQMNFQPAKKIAI